MGEICMCDCNEWKHGPSWQHGCLRVTLEHQRRQPVLAEAPSFFISKSPILRVWCKTPVQSQNLQEAFTGKEQQAKQVAPPPLHDPRKRTLSKRRIHPQGLPPKGTELVRRTFLQSLNLTLHTHWLLISAPSYPNTFHLEGGDRKK